MTLNLGIMPVARWLPDYWGDALQSATNFPYGTRYRHVGCEIVLEVSSLPLQYPLFPGGKILAEHGPNLFCTRSDKIEEFRRVFEFHLI